MLVSSDELAFSLPWLHGKLKLDESFNLYNLLCDLRAGWYNKHYKHWYLGKRSIYEPVGELKLVQRKLNRFLLNQFPAPVASFGFSGGSCGQAAEIHLGYSSVLTLDLKNAFHQITNQNVRSVLQGQDSQGEHFLSRRCARYVADLCTIGGKYYFTDRDKVGGFLPQGPPSSPRIFDLVMEQFDKVMLGWSNRRNFRYCRYADNLIFSSRHPYFPPKQRAIILSEVAKHYDYHKVHQTDGGKMCRMLGLNLLPAGVHNTRQFKRSFRGALYHLEYCLDNELSYEKAWRVVKGYWGFVIKNTLPTNLSDQFDSLQKRVHVLEWGF